MGVCDSKDLEDVPHTALLTVAVVIPTSGRLQQLGSVLDKLSAQNARIDETIVVGSGAGCEGSESVAQSWGARFVPEPRGGASRARNLGALHASSDVVAFLDDDAIPSDDWLKALMAEFTDPGVSAVGGRIRPAVDETDHPSAIFSAAAAVSWFGGEDRIVVDRDTEDWFEFLNFYGVAIGPNMAFRRSLFEEWNGFDERIGPGTVVRGGEEQLAFFQIVAAGHRVVYTPEALVYHPVPMPDLGTARWRYNRALETRGAYIALLWSEYPEFRKRTVRYTVARARGDRPVWQRQVIQNRPIWKRPFTVIRYLRGALTYLSRLY